MAGVFALLVGDSVRAWTETIADVLFVLLAVALASFLVAISVRSACCDAAPSPAAVGKPARPPSPHASDRLRKEAGSAAVRYQTSAHDSIFMQAQRSTIIVPLSARTIPNSSRRSALASVSCGRCGESTGSTNV
jgi:hypothetical protein